MTRASAAEKYVTIEGYHLGETEKAVRFSIHVVEGKEMIDKKTEWFPLSQIKSITRSTETGELDMLVVKEWIAQQKNLV